MSARTRDELIGDLRALADLLASDEAIPFDSYTTHIQHHVSADDDETGVHRLHEIAAVLDVEPSVIDTYGGHHHCVSKAIGGITYEAVYIEQQVMVEYTEAGRIVKAHRAAREVAEPPTDEAMDGALLYLADQLNRHPEVLDDEHTGAVTE